MTPRRLIMAFVALCVAAFVATIPLPRVDNLLIGSDGIGYYAYLPSLWLDQDLDFTNQYAVLYAYQSDDENSFIHVRTAQGVPPNQWSIGPALLWSPFFLMAHGLVLLLQAGGANIAADGVGYVYQAFVSVGSIVYAGCALWLSHLFVRSWTTSNAAIAAVLLTVMAGNLIYYMTAEPSMSHGVSAFASALFCWLWAKRRDRDDLTTALLLGGAAGLMALIRPQDGLFIGLVLLDRTPRLVHYLRTQDWTGMAAWGRFVLVLGIAALVVFSPLPLSWQAIYGSPFHSGYADSGHTFRWLSPRLGEVLFSAERGLFVWHPVFLFALIGCGLLWQQDRRMAWLTIAGVLSQWYLIASWADWTQGDAFGGRMFIVCTPLFALGLARLAQFTIERGQLRSATLAAALLVGLNFLLYVEYRFYLVMLDRPVTWYEITAGRVTVPLDLLSRFLN